MAQRRPLCRIGGVTKELPAGDSVATGANAFFVSPSTPLPTLSALGSSTNTFTVTPNLAGDALAKGEVITVVPDSGLPGGLNISYVIVSAANQVTIGFSAVVSITSSNRIWTVVAHR